MYAMDVDEGLSNTGKHGTGSSVVLKDDELCQEQADEVETCDLTQQEPREVTGLDEDQQIEEDIARSECKLCTVKLASESVSSEQVLHGSASAMDASDSMELNAECDKLISSNGTKPLHECVADNSDLQAEIARAAFVMQQTVTVPLSSGQHRSVDACLNTAGAVGGGKVATDPSSLTHFDEFVDHNAEFQANAEEKCGCPLNSGSVNSDNTSQRNLPAGDCLDLQRSVISVEIHGSVDESVLCAGEVAATSHCSADTVCLQTSVGPPVNDGHYCCKIPRDEDALVKSLDEHSLCKNFKSSNSHPCQEIALNSDYTAPRSLRPESTDVISPAVVSDDSCVGLGRCCNSAVETSCKSSSALERHGSRGSIERFLAPSAPVSKGITTPVDDPGFAKVPGYTSELAVMEEEDAKHIDATSEHPQLDSLQLALAAENADNTGSANRTFSVCPGEDMKLNIANETEPVVMRTEKAGARTRTSRPNSLLGLSKPSVSLLDPCQELRQNDERTEASEPLANTPRITVETDAQFGLSRPRQRPVMSLILDKEQPNSLSLSQRPVSWSPAPISLQPPSANTSKRPCSLNLPIGLSQESVPRNSGPTETKCRRTLRGGLPVGKETLPLPAAAAAAAVPTPQPSSSELSPVQQTVLSLPSVQSPRVATLTSVGSAVGGRDHTSCITETVPVPEYTSSQSTPLSPSQPRAEVISILSATEGSVPLNSSANVSIYELGKVAPVWVPDASAPRCMHCECRFTFTRRRHHCRACGKVTLLAI